MGTIRFYRTGDPYGNFSNFAAFPIYIDNEWWRTSEHYFQASKFHDRAAKDAIQALESPMKAASEGRKRTYPLRPDWEAVKDDAMRIALRAKFTQHPSLRKELLETGDAHLIEHTVNDSYWADGGDGTGKNMLGILLMELRTQQRALAPEPDRILPPWIAFPGISQDDAFWQNGGGEKYMQIWREYMAKTGAAPQWQIE